MIFGRILGKSGRMRRLLSKGYISIASIYNLFRLLLNFLIIKDTKANTEYTKKIRY